MLCRAVIYVRSPPPLHTHTHAHSHFPCSYSYENAPVQKELAATEVGSVAAFLLSPLASAGEPPSVASVLLCSGCPGWRSLCTHTAHLPVAAALIAVTGQVVYVDNGLSVMGLAVDSKTLDREIGA